MYVHYWSTGSKWIRFMNSSHNLLWFVTGRWCVPLCCFDVRFCMILWSISFRCVTAVWNVTYQIWTNLFHFEFLIDAKLNFYFICSLYWPKLSFVFILPWRLYAGFHALYLNIVFCEFEIRSKNFYQTLFFFFIFCTNILKLMLSLNQYICQKFFLKRRTMVLISYCYFAFLSIRYYGEK